MDHPVLSTELTLRDYFATQALAHQDIRFVIKVFPRGKGEPNHVEMPPTQWTPEMRRAVAVWAAKDAYAMADAMLAEREK